MCERKRMCVRARESIVCLAVNYTLNFNSQVRWRTRRLALPLLLFAGAPQRSRLAATRTRSLTRQPLIRKQDSISRRAGQSVCAQTASSTEGHRLTLTRCGASHETRDRAPSFTKLDSDTRVELMSAESAPNQSVVRINTTLKQRGLEVNQ